MADDSILLHYGTKSWSRRIVDNTTLFATKVKYMEILQEQVAGFIIFCFTLSTCISNIEARIFLHCYPYPRYVYTYSVWTAASD